MTLVKGYEAERTCGWKWDRASLWSDYSFRMAGIEEVQGPNYVAARARIEMLRENGEFVRGR